MDDISQKLGEILSDPSMLEQIKSLGGMLGLGGESSGQDEKSQASQKVSALRPAANPIGGISPEMMGMFMKFAPVLSSMNKENDSTRLLNSLRPFLSEKRQHRVDDAVRLLSIMNLLPLLKNIL